jgi:hypothetical protein
VSSQTRNTRIPWSSAVRRLFPNASGNALLVGGAVAVLVAMAGWLYFLGWLTWRLIAWILN